MVPRYLRFVKIAICPYLYLVSYFMKLCQLLLWLYFMSWNMEHWLLMVGWN